MEKEVKNAKYERQRRYLARRTTCISVRLVNTLDQEMIAWLDEHRPTAAYIKKLITADMRRAKKRTNQVDKEI